MFFSRSIGLRECPVELARSPRASSGTQFLLVARRYPVGEKIDKWTASKIKALTLAQKSGRAISLSGKSLEGKKLDQYQAFYATFEAEIGFTEPGFSDKSTEDLLLIAMVDRIIRSRKDEVLIRNAKGERV